MREDQGKSAFGMPLGEANTILRDNASLFRDVGLYYYLGTSDILAFSSTCRAAESILLEHYRDLLLKAILDVKNTASKKNKDLFDLMTKSHPILYNDPFILLTSVIYGNEYLARKILTLHPHLLIDTSATATDLSGKVVKGSTSLQAALCAGDVEMAQMMLDVMQISLRNGTRLPFEPLSEMQSQFNKVFQNGIEAVEAEQKEAARIFKTVLEIGNYNLRYVFNAINAAIPQQVAVELENPGQDNPESLLNIALRNFRQQFAEISNQEEIFNPFYLLSAIEFFEDNFNNFRIEDNAHWERRSLFWRQVMGYVERHMPACWLQTFAQGVYLVADKSEKLERNFSFKNSDDFYMLAMNNDFDGLGYRYAGVARGGWPTGDSIAVGYKGWKINSYQDLLQSKKREFETLFAPGMKSKLKHYILSRCEIS